MNSDSTVSGLSFGVQSAHGVREIIKKASRTGACIVRHKVGTFRRCVCVCDAVIDKQNQRVKGENHTQLP
jgi:hypothetical protein